MPESDPIPEGPVPYHESLLQWVWEQLRFDIGRLRTGTGEPVTILHPGVQNRSDGPDFREARIRIGDLTWCGDLEVHWHVRNWYRHYHHENPAYDNVILHVVYREEGTGQPVERSDGTFIPQLALGPCLSRPLHDFLDRYRRRIPLPCIGHLHRVRAEVFGRQISRSHSLYFDRKISDLLSLWPERPRPLSSAWKQMTGMALFDGLGIAHNRRQMRRLFVPLTGAISASGTRESFVRRAWFQAGLSGSDYGRAGSDFRRTRLTSHRTDTNLGKAGSDAGSRSPQAGSNSRHAAPNRARGRWKHRGSRPGNHPRRRIAQAAAAYWHLWHLPWEQVRTAGPDQMWEQITGSPPRHLRIGSERNSILYGTVMLPAYYLLGDFLGSRRMKSRAWQEWNRHRPRLPESLIDPFIRSPVSPDLYRNRLGAVYQLREFCSARRCAECEVFKSAISP